MNRLGDVCQSLRPRFALRPTPGECGAGDRVSFLRRNQQDIESLLQHASMVQHLMRSLAPLVIWLNGRDRGLATSIALLLAIKAPHATDFAPRLDEQMVAHDRSTDDVANVDSEQAK